MGTEKQLKKRTTVMLPAGLLSELDRVRTELGMSRSAILAASSAYFLAKTSAVLRPTKRAESLSAIGLLFTEILKEANETLLNQCPVD